MCNEELVETNPTVAVRIQCPTTRAVVTSVVNRGLQEFGFVNVTVEAEEGAETTIAAPSEVEAMMNIAVVECPDLLTTPISIIQELEYEIDINDPDTAGDDVPVVED